MLHKAEIVWKISQKKEETECRLIAKLNWSELNSRGGQLPGRQKHLAEVLYLFSFKADWDLYNFRIWRFSEQYVSLEKWGNEWRLNKMFWGHIIWSLLKKIFVLLLIRFRMMRAHMDLWLQWGRLCVVQDAWTICFSCFWLFCFFLLCTQGKRGSGLLLAVESNYIRIQGWETVLWWHLRDPEVGK